MNDRFVSFLLLSRWVSAIMALMYHIRFLMFVDYGDVQGGAGLTTAFYFLTGLGHESFAVFFVLDGIVSGLILLRHRARAAIDRAAVSQHLGSIYRILLPGLILGASFDVTGIQFFNQSGLYTAFPAFSTLTLTGSSLLGNVFMLQPFIVPTFGSNGMLYLLSYLFWSFVLLFLLVRAAELGRTRGSIAQSVLLAAVLFIMPYQFMIWAATWLAGVAVVVLGESRMSKPPVLIGIALFIGALVLSRLIGSNTGLLPHPVGEWLVRCKYLFVGITFAAIAWALYPKQAHAEPERLVFSAIGINNDQAGQAASFTFYCHFPVMMLLVAMGSVLLDQPIMQQPTFMGYVAFACVLAGCVGMTVVITRIVDIAVEAMAVRRWASWP